MLIEGQEVFTRPAAIAAKALLISSVTVAAIELYDVPIDNLEILSVALPIQRCQRLPFALTMLAALVACSSQRERLIEQGATPAHADGYANGCDSGKQAGGDIFAEAKKPARRYDDGGEYAEAWNEAFEICRADTAAKVREARRRNPHRNR